MGRAISLECRGCDPNEISTCSLALENERFISTTVYTVMQNYTKKTIFFLL
jgi:hypothetical protein